MTDIDEVLTSQDVPHYTKLRPMLWGSFNLSQISIPYYQAVLSLEEVATELKLVENLPSDLRAKWRLEELFQREINWERVRHEIFNGYLRRPEKLKFFNSLTVALLPLNPDRMLASVYGDTPVEPELREALRKAPWTPINAGGVQVVTNQTSPHGYIHWDPARIFPATIDGQHRLASLQMLHHEGNLTSAELDTKVSVIFLIMDPRVGFDIEKLQLSGDDNPILTVVREVFIDLNKHAEEVARARRILLDDQDIESRCVRSLLAKRVGEEEPGCLPLGLVHWQHNVTAKFNTGKPTGPFLTTVELLYSIVSDLLDLKRPKDPLDEKDVRRFVKSIESALGLSARITAAPDSYPDLKPLISYVDKMHLVEGFEVPFVNLPSPYLRASVDCFAARWSPLIVGVLTRFRPYADFITEVRQRGGIDGVLAFFLVQPRKAQDQQLKEWGEKKLEIIEKPLDELAQLKMTDWPFFAVFQKGLLRATATAYRHFGVLPGKSDGDTDAFMDLWIEFLNEMHQRGLFAVQAPLGTGSEKAWAGIALNPASATVRWSESAVQRICGLLMLWWYLYTSGMRQMGSFVKKVSRKRSSERFPLAKDFLKDMRTGLQQVITRAEEELPDEECERQVEQRLRKLLKHAVNESIEEEQVDDDTNEDPDDNRSESAEVVSSIEDDTIAEEE